MLVVSIIRQVLQQGLNGIANSLTRRGNMLVWRAFRDAITKRRSI